MAKFWKKKPAIGLGLGVGLAGALFLAVRYAMRRQVREPIPESISPAIFATRVAQTGFGEMVYHTSGAGEPVVFLHGLYIGASSYEWSKVYPHLAVGREVIAPDLIGFGESERRADAMDAGDYVQSLYDFLRVVSGRPVTLVASGLGASFALLLAVRHPEAVSRLVLYLPWGLDRWSRKAIPRGLQLLARAQRLNRFVYRNYFARKPFVRSWLNKVAFQNPANLTEEMIDVVATCAQQAGAEHAIRNLLAGRLWVDIEARLPDVPQPVSLLWPSDLVGASQRECERLQRSLPRSEATYLSDCGLLAPLENPPIFVAHLENMLSQELRAC